MKFPLVSTMSFAGAADERLETARTIPLQFSREGVERWRLNQQRNQRLFQ